MESEGHEEKYRAVIDGGHPEMNRSAKGGARSSLHYGGEGILVHLSYQGVCRRHDAEDLCVTPGELNVYLNGNKISDSISKTKAK